MLNDSQQKQLTDAELHVLYVMMGVGMEPGSFVYALISAISKSDPMNRGKLRSVFPEYVDAVNAYQHGDLWQRWEAASQSKKERL